MSLLESLARNSLHAADNLFARISTDSSAACGTLLSVLFHSLYRDKSQLGDSALARNQNVTVEDFRCFVSALLESGYTVVSPAQVDAGLKPGGNYALITFDDGYFNNTLALGVLEQFAVPATFFISSDHVLQSKAFWWDALSREMSKGGAADRAKIAEIRKVKSLGSEEVEQFLRQRFGQDVLRPKGDLDRPFTPAELRDFAQHKCVHIGNHTRSHAILTRCAPEEVARQIGDCQAALTQITGKAPLAVAYPNGNYSQLAVEASLAAGLRVGLTTLPHRNLLPLEPGKSRMTLGRFIFNGGEDARHQCRKFAASFIPSNAIKTLIHRAS
jgi:peptidoglycan/xylan/chitin deacetylase (PgdA/CDA1 family)